MRWTGLSNSEHHSGSMQILVIRVGRAASRLWGHRPNRTFELGNFKPALTNVLHASRIMLRVSAPFRAFGDSDRHPHGWPRIAATTGAGFVCANLPFVVIPVRAGNHRLASRGETRPYNSSNMRHRHDRGGFRVRRSAVRGDPGACGQPPSGVARGNPPLQFIQRATRHRHDGGGFRVRRSAVRGYPGACGQLPSGVARGNPPLQFIQHAPDRGGLGVWANGSGVVSVQMPP